MSDDAASGKAKFLVAAIRDGLDDVSAYTLVAAALTPLDDWRPIDTAPKDGTPVLLVVQYKPAGQGAMAVGVWNEIKRRWEDDDVGHGLWYSELFTHWRPLPQPPKART